MNCWCVHIPSRKVTLQWKVTISSINNISILTLVSTCGIFHFHPWKKRYLYNSCTDFLLSKNNVGWKPWKMLTFSASKSFAGSKVGIFLKPENIHWNSKIQWITDIVCKSCMILFGCLWWYHAIYHRGHFIDFFWYPWLLLQTCIHGLKPTESRKILWCHFGSKQTWR